MDKDEKITKEMFIKRLVTLLLRSGLSEFPKNKSDQFIILKSVVMSLNLNETFTEKELNEQIDNWIKAVGQVKNIDRVTIRRLLVDYGYLTRSKDGAVYQLVKPEPYLDNFDPSVEEVNVFETISQAREEIIRKREQFKSP